MSRITKAVSVVKNEAAARRVWRNADAVCFDVDSTLCTDEIIDELAKYLHCYEEISKCTEKAMNGAISFRESLKHRLDILRPTQKQLEEFSSNRPPKLTPGSEALVDELYRRHIAVYLVSGSFRTLILPVAKLLSIPQDNIYANEIIFDQSGRYRGFDETKPTSDSADSSGHFGKGAVCGMLKNEKNYRNLVMIGDGVTDLEASPPADLFIGFGGNRSHEIVRRKAPWFVYDFDTLRKCFDQYD